MRYLIESDQDIACQKVSMKPEQQLGIHATADNTPNFFMDERNWGKFGKETDLQAALPFTDVLIALSQTTAVAYLAWQNRENGNGDITTHQINLPATIERGHMMKLLEMEGLNLITFELAENASPTSGRQTWNVTVVILTGES